MRKLLFLFSILFFIFSSCQTSQTKEKNNEFMGKKTEKITLGGGCFWCVSSCYEMLKGVKKVTSGYSGGNNEYPTYQQVSSGTTGHAEVIQIEYDPEEISLLEILDIFWFLHDPTQLNRQGNDIGTQYRSVIFYNTKAQKILAQESLKKSQTKDLWKGEYVTQILPLIHFYPAEDYHQNYYNKNPEQPYCSIVIAPKIAKFINKFYHKLKPEFKN